MKTWTQPLYTRDGSFKISVSEEGDFLATRDGYFVLDGDGKRIQLTKKVVKDKDGKETTVKYYEYDTNFYAALVEDKVYLVNKMNVKDLDEAYQKMVNLDTEDAEESTSDIATEEN